MHGGGAALRVQLGQPLARDDGDDGAGGAFAGRLRRVGAGGGLGAEVGDADPVRPSGLDPGLDGGPRVVHVDVDVPQPVPADDDERVPERVEPPRSRSTAASSASRR